MYLLVFILAFAFLYFLMSFARGVADKIDSHNKKNVSQEHNSDDYEQRTESAKNEEDQKIIEITDFEIKDDD